MCLHGLKRMSCINSSQYVTVNVGSLSNALTAAIQQATSGSQSISVFATPMTPSSAVHDLMVPQVFPLGYSCQNFVLSPSIHNVC